MFQRATASLRINICSLDTEHLHQFGRADKYLPILDKNVRYQEKNINGSAYRSVSLAVIGTRKFTNEVPGERNKACERSKI